MKIILTANIKKLGKVGELVTVKDGFARNYLLPKKMALRNNKKKLEFYEKLKEEIQIKESITQKNAEDLLKTLDNISISFEKEADEKDQLYGSVTAKEIQTYLSEKDIKINIDDIQIKEPIKSLGDHKVYMNPYDDLSKIIKVSVNKAKEK